MAERHESSGLISLASLREHEQRRAIEQAEGARQRAEAEQHARRLAERESARIAQERLCSERTTRALAESAERAEQGRIEAELRAQCQRAERLAQAARELELTLSGERTARRSAEFEFSARLLRQRLGTSLCAALCVGTWLSASALYFGALRPAAERALTGVQHSLLSEQRAQREAQASAARLAQHSADQAQRIASLEQTLREERTLKERAPLPQSAPQKPVGHRPIASTPAKPCRDDGDPLNPCLKR